MILQNAQCQQKEKENWKIITPEGEEILDIKGDYNDHEIMDLLRKLREIESWAFNKGICSKGIMDKISIRVENETLKKRNEELSDALHRALNKE